MPYLISCCILIGNDAIEGQTAKVKKYFAIMEQKISFQRKECPSGWFKVNKSCL
jgi:hypothetical protein